MLRISRIFRRFRRDKKESRVAAATQKPVAKPGLEKTKKLQRLLSDLNEKLKDKAFFGSLPKTDPIFSSLKNFSFEGVDVVIKDTRGFDCEGKNFNELRNSFLAHQKAVRSGELRPKNYFLKSIKVYGRIGDYLIMQRIKTIRDYEMYESDKWTLEKIRTELRHTFYGLLGKGLIKVVPQADHIMFPRSRKKINGRLVVYMPYDTG